MLLHSKIIGAGKPFLILHGFLGMGDNWNTLGLKFSKQHYQVHLIDQRNHGRSFHDKHFNYDVLVEDLKYYCDYYQFKEVILLGHSMGGKAAMLFATVYDYLVQKLIVVDIAPKDYPPNHQIIFDAFFAVDIEHISSRKEAEEALSEYLKDEGVIQFLLKNIAIVVC